MSDPSRRRLLRVITERATPATVADLVATVGGHPNTTRHHLRVLADAGLVTEEHGLPAGGRGRPATRYAVSLAGREAASPAMGSSAAREYVALAAAFADRLAERDGDPAVDSRAIGKAWGAGLAVRHATDEGLDQPPVAQVLGLLDRLGFSPEVERAQEPDSGSTVLLRTCPLLDAARRHPEVVCQVHLGLVDGALESHEQPSGGLSLHPFARPGACELVLPPTLVS
ncbi:MAG TPA: helix-turn-helix domain-containing protein [Ornithinibacter sp.]|nr:helix-turn-helix domain-containing protein [Ornithinibacter sp.]